MDDLTAPGSAAPQRRPVADVLRSALRSRRGRVVVGVALVALMLYRGYFSFFTGEDWHASAWAVPYLVVFGLWLLGGWPLRSRDVDAPVEPRSDA